MKKIISILLAVMILTSMTTVAMAAKQKKTAAFTGTLSVTGPTSTLKPGTNTALKAKVKKANQ